MAFFIGDFDFTLQFINELAFVVDIKVGECWDSKITFEL